MKIFLLGWFLEKFAFKEPQEPQSEQENQDKVLVESDKGPDIAIAELDSVINSYHSAGSNGTKSSGNGMYLMLI